MDTLIFLVDEKFRIIEGLDKLCETGVMECKRWLHWKELISEPKGKELYEEEQLLKKESVNIWKSGKIMLEKFFSVGFQQEEENKILKCHSEFRKYKFVGSDGKVW
jgi:hypothetical protein